MNKKVIAIVVGVVVVGGGYLAYEKFAGKSGDNAGNSAPQQNTQNGANGSVSGTVKEGGGANSKPAPGSGTFASVVARGENLACSFEYNDGKNITVGNVYLADKAKRIRGDFNIHQSAAGQMQVTLIRVNGDNYIWSSLLSSGVKMRVTPEEEGRLLSSKDGGVDENTVFNCTPWVVDSSKFTLPTNITFTDVTPQLQ